MARCGCEGLTCACQIKADPDGTATVTGIGTQDSPYLISSNTKTTVVVSDTPTIDMHVSGSGQPYTLYANLTAVLNDLTDVNVPGSVPVGNVLSWNGTTWAPAAPSTVSAGAIHAAGCVKGDGSTGTPLDVKVDAAGGLQCGANGLGLKPAELDLINNGPDLVPWAHNWNANSAAMKYGSSDIEAEYARWGQFCFLRFAFSGGTGFNGGTGDYHWTAPFPTDGPSGSPLTVYLRTSDSSYWTGIAQVVVNSTDIVLFLPKNGDSARLDAMRNADPGNLGVGHSVPVVPNGYALDGTSVSRLTFHGWYRIKDGF